MRSGVRKDIQSVELAWTVLHAELKSLDSIFFRGEELRTENKIKTHTHIVREKKGIFCLPLGS